MTMIFRYKKWDAVYKGNESNVFNKGFIPLFYFAKKRKDDENAKE